MTVGVFKDRGPTHRLAGISMKVARCPPFEVAELRPVDSFDCYGVRIGRVAGVEFQAQNFHWFTFRDDRSSTTAIRIRRGYAGNPGIEVFVSMGGNVLLKRCFKGVIVGMLTHDRLR